MSNTANWSYTNIAQVRPLTGRDRWGAKTYGETYEIACTWEAFQTEQREMGGQQGAQGVELIGKHTVYTEDPRPQKGDELMFAGSNGWEEIRERTNWDMSFFGEIPDFKLVT